jgi:large repetitive protein
MSCCCRATRDGVALVLPLAFLLLLLGGTPALAAPTLRFAADTPGGYAVTGQTLGYDCGSGQAPPVGSTVTCSGVLDGDSAADLYWRDQVASVGVAAVDARTSALLALPTGSTVLHARLYWGALRANEAPDRDVTLDREGGFSAAVTADDSRAVPASGPLVGVAYVAYQSSADVTQIVRTNRDGVYRVTGVDAIALNGVLSENAFSAWHLVVVYDLPTGAQRRLALYDGLDPVTASAETFVAVDGFAVPSAGTPQGTLAAWSFEGDASQTGDALRIKTSNTSNALNPADNFWNESRSSVGAAVTGSVPALTGQPATGAGFDLDEIDLGPLLAGGDRSMRVTATSTQDEYWFGGFVLSIASEGPPPGLDGGTDGADAGLDGAGGDGGSGLDGGDGGDTVGGDGGNVDAATDGSGGGGGGDANPGDGNGPVPPRDGGGDGAGSDVRRDAGAPGANDESVIAEGSGCQCGIGARAPLPIAAALPWCVLYFLARARRRWRQKPETS